MCISRATMLLNQKIVQFFEAYYGLCSDNSPSRKSLY